MSKYLEMQRKIRNMALGGEVTIVKPEDERLFSGSSTKATVYPPGPNPYTLRDEMGIAPSVALSPIKMQEGGTVPQSKYLSAYQKMKSGEIPEDYERLVKLYNPSPSAAYDESAIIENALGNLPIKMAEGGVSPVDGTPLAPPPQPTQAELDKAEIEAATNEVNDILQNEPGLDEPTKTELLKQARADAEMVVRNKGDKSSILTNLASRIEKVRATPEAPSLKAKAAPKTGAAETGLDPRAYAPGSVDEAEVRAANERDIKSSRPSPPEAPTLVAPPPPPAPEAPPVVVPAPPPAPLASSTPPVVPESGLGQAQIDKAMSAAGFQKGVAPTPVAAPPAKAPAEPPTVTVEPAVQAASVDYIKTLALEAGMSEDAAEALAAPFREMGPASINLNDPTLLELKKAAEDRRRIDSEERAANLALFDGAADLRQSERLDKAALYKEALDKQKEMFQLQKDLLADVKDTQALVKAALGQQLGFMPGLLGVIGAGLGSKESVADFFREKRNDTINSLSATMGSKVNLLTQLFQQTGNIDAATKFGESTLDSLYAELIGSSLPQVADQRGRAILERQMLDLRMASMKKDEEAKKLVMDQLEAPLKERNDREARQLQFTQSILAQHFSTKRAEAAQRTRQAIASAKGTAPKAGKPIKPGEPGYLSPENLQSQPMVGKALRGAVMDEAEVVEALNYDPSTLFFTPIYEYNRKTDQMELVGKKLANGSGQKDTTVAKDNVQKLTAAGEATADITDNIKVMQSVLTDPAINYSYTKLYGLAGVGGNKALKERYDQARAAIIGKIGVIRNTGVMNETELSRYEGMVGQLGRTISADTTKASLSELKSGFIRGYQKGVEARTPVLTIPSDSIDALIANPNAPANSSDPRYQGMTVRQLFDAIYGKGASNKYVSSGGR